MTRDELLALPITALVNLVLEYQATVERLQARVFELEGRTGSEEIKRQGELQPEASVPASAQEGGGHLFPSGPVQVLPASDPNYHSHRSHGSSRSWSRRIKHSLNMDGGFNWSYLAIGLAIVLVAAVIGLMIVQFNLPLGITTGRR